MRRLRWPLMLAALTVAPLIAAGCTGQTAPTPPTATLAPIVSLTPRSTATLVPSATPQPTLTLTPSTTPSPAPPTLSPTPTSTPPVLGSVSSLNDVNMREGPNVSFPALSALRPGTGVTVLATDETGGWYNVRLDDESEGWISATLVRLQPSPTPPASLTPTPDGTLLALGGPLPTAILGGQPVTPTPPRVVVTPEGSPTAGGAQLPDLASINQTATALASGGVARPVGGPTGGPLPAGSATAAPPIGNAERQQGVEVFATCNNPAGGVPPAPANLVTGSTIEITWAWYAATRELLADNVAKANFDLRLNGVPVTGITAGEPRQKADGNWWQYFYAAPPPLNSGRQEIALTMTWDSPTNDGYSDYGPGTGQPSYTGSCTFTVR